VEGVPSTRPVGLADTSVTVALARQTTGSSRLSEMARECGFGQVVSKLSRLNAF
jgi:hypothetical protein